jgi:hypothetical protein
MGQHTLNMLLIYFYFSIISMEVNFIVWDFEGILRFPHASAELRFRNVKYR